MSEVETRGLVPMCGYHSLLLLVLKALSGFGSAIWQKRGLDVPDLQGGLG